MKKAALVISLFVFSIGSFSQKNNNLKKPNIIYILADDLGYGELHAVVPLVGECYASCLHTEHQQGRKAFISSVTLSQSTDDNFSSVSFMLLQFNFRNQPWQLPNRSSLVCE